MTRDEETEMGERASVQRDVPARGRTLHTLTSLESI